MEAVKKDKTKLDEFIDEVVNSGKSADELLQEGGLLKELFKRVAERALDAEMAMHLGYEKHAVAGRGTGNSRNGKRFHDNSPAMFPGLQAYRHYGN